MRKVAEAIGLRPHGIFETLGSKMSHGASKKIADVPTHLREVYNRNFLIKGHHMVAFLWLIIYLNIHKQEWEKLKWASTGICGGFDELLNCVILFSELDGWFWLCDFFKYQNYFLFSENNTWFPFLTAL